MAPTLTPGELAAEEWRDVPGLANREVSTLGRYRVTRNGKPLPAHRGTPQSGGYLMVNAAGRNYLVHVLVLTTFVGPRPAGMDACHGNGDRQDNRLANLRWDSHLANMADAARHGTVDAKLAPYRHLLGVVRDVEIVRLSGATASAVCHARQRLGIPVCPRKQRAA